MKIIPKCFNFIFTKCILLHSILNGVDCTHVINTFRFCFLWDYNLHMKLVNLELEVLLQYCQLFKYYHLPYVSFMFQTQSKVLKKRTQQHHNSVLLINGQYVLIFLFQIWATRSVPKYKIWTSILSLWTFWFLNQS